MGGRGFTPFLPKAAHGDHDKEEVEGSLSFYLIMQLHITVKHGSLF